MAHRIETVISQPVAAEQSIGPGRQLLPINGGNGGNGDGGHGGGGGCMGGTVLLDLSLAMDPSTLFTTVGTPVQLTGSAAVRHWSPDCSHHDAGAQTVWNLSYQSLNGGLSINVTSLLAEDPRSPTNQFTPGIPGTYDVTLTCPLVAASTSARLFAGRGAVLDGTATAWVDLALPEFLGGGCKKFATDPGGNPIRFHAVMVTSPQGTQSTVDFDPIRTGKAVITETSAGTGSLDLSTGTIEVQIHGAVQAAGRNGTVDMILSTSGTIRPCDGSSASGSAIRDGQAVLVGSAPVDGLPVAATAWLEVNANVIAVGF